MTDETQTCVTALDVVPEGGETVIRSFALIGVQATCPRDRPIGAVRAALWASLVPSLVEQIGM